MTEKHSIERIRGDKIKYNLNENDMSYASDGWTLRV
jgi:hypothetical protein